MAERTKYILDESEMPTTWYNVVPDLPQPPPPPLHPGTQQPLGPDDLAPVPHGPHRPRGLGDRYIDIPGAVLDVYTDVASDTAVPGAPAGEGTRHPGAYLLQV